MNKFKEIKTNNNNKKSKEYSTLTESKAKHINKSKRRHYKHQL